RPTLTAIGLPLGGIGLGLAVAFWLQRMRAIPLSVFLGPRTVSPPRSIPMDFHRPAWLAVGFALVLTAPIGEDLFVRGFLYGNLRARFAPLVGRHALLLRLRTRPRIF